MNTSLREFLENTPPGTEEVVPVGVRTTAIVPGLGYRDPAVEFPKIRLHCWSEECGGERWFDTTDKTTLHNVLSGSSHWSSFVCYNCRDCGKSSKVYALVVKRIQGDTFSLVKIGEVPAFGPPTPSRASSLIGDDRDLFFKGRRCEAQGLGVGAFAYYRRVIENQKSRIFREMIRVLKAVSPGDEVIADLERAAEETQFSKSMEAIKHALPSSLSIRGQNPIALLHTALSEGIHALDDETCLEYAQAIRTVLFETADRLSAAMRDDAEVIKAVQLLSRAGNKQQPKQHAKGPPTSPSLSENPTPQD